MDAVALTTLLDADLYMDKATTAAAIRVMANVVDHAEADNRLLRAGATPARG